ncbi:MAG: DUF3800 domain-containing protein [Candidatus Heimdallarchaeota archaeon]|nr:DUF3800 domain-containing protein [Candidatus Heimdallarchaeota archaeon]
MYFAFIKESGIATMNDEGNYVLSAVLIQENNVEGIVESIINMKREIYDDEVLYTSYFSITDILRARNAFNEVSMEDRIDTLIDIATFINSLELVIISVMIDKSNIYSQTGNHYSTLWITEWAWKLMLERLSRYADEFDEEFVIIRNQTNPEFDYSLQSLLDGIDSKYMRGNYAGIEFIPSSPHSPLQLAELVAWTVRRYYSSDIEYDLMSTLSKKLFDAITPKFVGYDCNEIMGYGMKIFPVDPVDEEKLKIWFNPLLFFNDFFMLPRMEFIYDEE